MQVQEFYTLVPHIDTINRNQVDETLVKIRGTYDKMDDQNLSFAMYKMSESIMKLKSINPEIHDFLEECIKDIIRISTHRNFSIGSQALRNIFNTDAQYYKHSRLDVESRLPLGLRHPLKNYEPEVGQQCDIVKPYISSISYCGWTRGTIISKDGKKYLVKYANSQIPSQTKDEPFCAPLGSRTEDFEWRMNLKIGDEVEAFHKVWYRGTIAGVQLQNGTKRVRVTFKTFHQNGQKVDRHGQRYDGLQSQEDQCYDVTSYRIQKVGTMAKTFCEYSATAQQFLVDDTYDLVFRKQYEEEKFNAIMRLNFIRSLSFLQFYKTFCQCQGNEKFLQLLEHYNKDNLEAVFNVMVVVGNTSFLIPHMRVGQFFPHMINKVIEFLYANTKNLSPARNDMSSFFIDVIGKRVMSLSEKHAVVHQIRKRLAIDFLKYNMQKQMIALRLLYEIINPLPKKYTQQERQKANEFLVQQNIFYQLIQPNTHEQILLRAVQLIKYMFQNSLISFKQIEYLWNIYPASDIRGRATVQKMIGEISKVLTKDDTIKLIERLLRYKEEELTSDNLSLLRSLKDHKQLTDEIRLSILEKMWQIITQKSTNITQAIQGEVEIVFKSILPSLTSNNTKLQLLMLILHRLEQGKYHRSEFDILKDVILTYPKSIDPKSKNNDILKIEEETQQHQMKDQSEEIQIESNFLPQTLADVMEYLKQKRIYETITNLFNQLKNPQKMKTVLWFTSFLFEHDKDQVSSIVKVFYDKMGPTDEFFEWAQHIVERAQIFFVEFLENVEDMGKFQQLSIKGFDALKKIIFDVNVNLKNIKIVKKMKSTSVQSSQNTKQNEKNQSSIKGPVYGPSQKPQTLTFLYLLRSPYECKGVKFLQELLCVVKNCKVYDEIIKMIIQFFVNLDESIIPRTKQFRSQFLMDIINKFSEINNKNEFNDKVKTRLEMNVGLLQQLFAQTQKDGLLDVKPHFESVEGEMLKLSIENHITNNKVADQKIEVSENVTLWTFKVIIAHLFNEKPEDLSVHKFMSPIADELNAKSISELHFYNKESIRIQRKSAKDIPRKELVNETGEALSPKFDKIVQKWFNSYKNESSVLGMEELKKLSSELWKGSALKQANKLSEMIQKFDLTKKNALSLQEFKQFFIFKSAQNSPAVWKLINLSGYLNNLRRKDDQVEEINDSDIYPRRILSNEKVYSVIFSLLENPTFEPVHLNFYRLLSQLQTDTTLKQQVRKNAKALISDQKSVYKLSYILQTILAEILVNDEFFVEFYRAKGCEFIFSKFSEIISEEKSIYTFDTLLKTIIMPNMLKITNSYIYCLHSSVKMNRFLRKAKINHIQLDFLESQVKKVDEITEQKNENEGRLVELNKIEPYINEHEWLQLSEKILKNLINYFNNDLLQKLTNELIRLYSLLSLTQNQLNFDTILSGLKSESLNYRRSCQNIAYLYILNNQPHVKHFLQLLLTNLPQQSKGIFSYYFKLLEKVLQMYIDMKVQEKDDTEFIQLAGRLFKKLFEQLSNENRNSVVADKLLLGVLMVINVLVTRRPNVCKYFVHLKKQLLTKCLFFYHPKQRIAQLEVTPQLLTAPTQPNHFPDYVKCKSQQTRKILMQIIFHLHQVSAQEDPLFIDQYILPVFDDLPDKKIKFDTKSMQVGLCNLGSTCYMNSMLQLIHSVPQFRNLLMMSKIQAPLVKQLQKMFAYLYYSQRQDYTPQDLLKAFTPPIQKGIQQDTTQFLNILFDQLDKCLKGTPQHNLLQEMFQGTQATQMICHTCQQKRQRQETFFTYSVEIQGKYDLNSALQGMNLGEVISDCACEYCGQRSDTTKRTIIDTIPKLFFVPLKRIVFNYDVFMNTKIHTRLDFPAELNFEPYTKEGIELRQSLGLEYMKNLKDNEEKRKKFQQLAMHGHEKDYYKLKLKGIIVHSGGPQVGHYWAITRKQNNWVKFDDSKVAVFPHSGMQNECFGGNFQSDEWGGMGSSTNAYVLLYQRQLKHDVVLGQEQQQSRRVIPFDKIETFNTAELYKQVWLDNHSLMLENHLLKESYCKQFLHFLVQMLKITPSQSKIKVIAQTLYKVCYHSGLVGRLSETLLENLSQLDYQIFAKYILQDKNKTFELLFHNNHPVRELTAIFIEKTVLECYRKGTNEQKQEIKKFIDEYLLLIHHEVAKNWLRIDGYFKLFEGLIVGSVDLPQLYKYFIDKHLIAYFIDFIMEKSSPLTIYPKKYSIGTKSNPAHFGHALQLIFFLVKRVIFYFILKSYGFTGQNYELPAPPADQIFHFSQNDALCLSSIPFYEKMLRERQNLEILGLIIQRLSIKNLKFSQAIGRLMLIQLNQITDTKDEMGDICDCISKYLVITDEFWKNRAEFILGYSSPYIFNNNLLAALDEERFVYSSTLQDLFPVQCLFAYCHINKLRNPLTILHIIKTILQGCSVSYEARQYLLSQRAPSYINERYFDWLRPYVNNIVETLNLSKQKKQEILKQVQICNNYLNDIEKQKLPIDNVITGKIGNSFVVDRFSSSDNSIEVVISNVQTYLVKSKPTGLGNEVLDGFLVNGRFSKKVTSDSNILLLFKEFSKPLAIKQAIEEAQDKELISLFDDCVDSRPKSSKNVETQANSQPPSQEIVKITQNKDKLMHEQNNIKPITEQEKIIPQQPSSNKIQQQPELIEQVNVQGVELCQDYFRKIEIINNINKTKRVTLLFRTNEKSNMLVPSKVFFVSTKVAVETIWICKVDSTKGWGTVDYELIVEEKQAKPLPKSFKLYRDAQQVKNTTQTMQVQGPCNEQLQYQPQNHTDNNFPEQLTQIGCPVCTLLNLSTETNCQACGSNLRD